jgi:hypothetical protein
LPKGNAINLERDTVARFSQKKSCEVKAAQADGSQISNLLWTTNNMGAVGDSKATETALKLLFC